MKDFTLKEKDTLLQLAAHKDKLSKTSTGTLATFKVVYQSLDRAERRVFNLISSINPADYGSNESIINQHEQKTNVTAIRDQAYIDPDDGKKKILSPRYLPTHIYEQFTKMNRAMKKDIGKTVVVNYGYRAFGYQILLLCWLLVNVYDYNLEKTLKRVLLPQCSQHCSTTQTALDLMSYRDKTTEESIWAFSKSDEYQWLRSHAAEFGFKESYPQHNTSSVMWEPWHWQFVDEKIS